MDVFKSRLTVNDVEVVFKHQRFGALGSAGTGTRSNVRSKLSLGAGIQGLLGEGPSSPHVLEIVVGCEQGQHVARYVGLQVPLGAACGIVRELT